MPVRFGDFLSPRARQVLQYHVDASLFVVAGADRSFDRQTPLHWLSAQARAVPCTHEDCPWHHLPVRVVTYLPVLAYTHDGKSWKERVLPILQGMRDFLSEQREQVVYEFCRRGKKNSPVKWIRHKETKWAHPFAGFDVEASLYQMWGMYSNAKRTVDRIGEDGPRLFDECPNADVG